MSILEDYNFARRQIILKGIGDKLPLGYLFLLTLMGRKNRNKIREETAKRILERQEYAIQIKQDIEDDVVKYALDIEECYMCCTRIVMWEDT